MNLSDLSEKFNLEAKLAALDSLKQRLFPTDGGVPVQGARVEADSWADRRPEAGLDRDPQYTPPESVPETEASSGDSFAHFLDSVGLGRNEAADEPLYGGAAVEEREKSASEAAAHPVTVKPAEPSAPAAESEAEVAADTEAPAGESPEDEYDDEEDGSEKPRQRKPAGPTPEQLRARHRAFQQTTALLWSGSIVLGIVATAVALIYAMVT